jgi:hypothetical protein
MSQQELQQAELRDREVQLALAAVDLARVPIQDEIAEADGDAGLGLRRRPHRDHAGAQVGDVLRLAREHDDHDGCVIGGTERIRRA